MLVLQRTRLHSIILQTAKQCVSTLITPPHTHTHKHQQTKPINPAATQRARQEGNSRTVTQINLLDLALLQQYEGQLGLGDSYTSAEWQSDEERWRRLSEVHLQMEMTGLLMTGLYCVIVESCRWIGVPAII